MASQGKRSFPHIGKYSIYIILIVLIIAGSLLSPAFLTSDNLINILRQVTVVSILALGAMVLIICGQIDLSSGSVLALSGVLAVDVYKMTGSTTVAILAAIVVGILCNLFNAVASATFHVPPFIASLAMMLIARGAALLYTQGQNILQLGEFTFIGQGSIFGVPVPILFLVAVVIVVVYLLKQTKFGRSVYAIGGNEQASRASGINVARVKYQAFILNGALVGLAGAIFMSRVNAGLPNGAQGYELEGITAAIVGGTSFTGGVGTATGTVAGGLIIGLLNNIMNLLGIQSYVQQITKGLIITIAVIYDIRSKKGVISRTILRKRSNGNDSEKEAAGQSGLAEIPGGAESKE